MVGGSTNADFYLTTDDGAACLENAFLTLAVTLWITISLLLNKQNRRFTVRLDPVTLRPNTLFLYMYTTTRNSDILK